MKHKTIKVEDAVKDKEIVRKIREAGGIWFLGGAQRRITTALLEKDGSHTPRVEAIWEAHRDGAVVGGSGAGAAVMSRMMFADALSSLETIRQGIDKGVHVDRGLGFVGDKWFVDQHFLMRGRFARALHAMRDLGFKFGIGVDENTAVVLKDGVFEVVGYKGALVLDISDAESGKPAVPFRIRKARLSYLESGDRMDARTGKVTVGQPRRSSAKIDPKAANFEPGYTSAAEFYFPGHACPVGDLQCHDAAPRQQEGGSEGIRVRAAGGRPPQPHRLRVQGVRGGTRSAGTAAGQPRGATPSSTPMSISPRCVYGSSSTNGWSHDRRNWANSLSR